MNYDETLEFLYSQLPAYHRIGKPAYKNNLDNTLALDEYSGNPHRLYKTIHIAGTNGKGSVSHLIASVLMESGYRTGLFTSPHLRDFRERIRINGKMIPRSTVIKFVRDHQPVIKSLKPSFFEMTAAMSFSYFADAGADVAVIETGLGGRLDSTNIITPVLSVITNVGHDHMDMLGDSLQKIAAEKAGIIKQNVPVVISETQPETAGIFLSKAEGTDSPLSFADTNFSCIPGGYSKSGKTRNFAVTDLSSGRVINVESGLHGDYQAGNLKALFEVFRVMEGFIITEDDILRGIRNVVRNTGIMGRWQVLGRSPLIVCDTGHNREGLEFVIKQIRNQPKNRLHMVLGFVNDKDVRSLLSVMPEDAIYYFTRASVERAMDENVLLSEALRAGLEGKSYRDVRSAMIAAIGNAEEDDMIFIGGSTFVVAEVV